MATRDGGPDPVSSPGRFSELRVLLSTAPPAGKNTAIVGHGFPYYSLIGKGQMLEEGVSAGEPAQAKFCLECVTPLALRCAQCGTQLPAEAKFCFECATPVKRRAMRMPVDVRVCREVARRE
jgi:hypothetical protein